MIKVNKVIGETVTRCMLLILVISGILISRAYCAEPEAKELPKTKGFWGLNHAAPETEDKQGLLLIYIMPGGPSDRAGLQVNDLILEINGQKISEETFQPWIDSSKTGDELTLTVMRAGEKITKIITLGDRTVELQPKNFKRNYTKMQSLGTYIVMLPPDYDSSQIEYPLCVILHGMGSTELGHGRLADEFGRQGVIYIAPRYSYPFVEGFIEDKQEGYSGYPSYDSKDDESNYPIVENLSVDWIFSCVADAKKRYRIAGDKVFILGHSEGAFFSIACASLHPELVKSYFAYAPYIPDYYISKEKLNGLKKNKVKVYLVHGTEDKQLEPEVTIKAAKTMSDAGVDCTFKAFKTDHSFSQEIVSFAKEWLDAEVRPAKK